MRSGWDVNSGVMFAGVRISFKDTSRRYESFQLDFVCMAVQYRLTRMRRSSASNSGGQQLLELSQLFRRGLEVRRRGRSEINGLSVQGIIHTLKHTEKRQQLK